MVRSAVLMAAASAALLFAAACRLQAKAPPGVDFPRKTVTWTSITTYPVVVDGRYAARRSSSLPQHVSYGPGLAITYHVGWRFDAAGLAPPISESQCEGLPEGDVFVRGSKVEKPAFACSPVAAGEQQSGRPPGLWLVLEERCRRGTAGYGASELELEAAPGEDGSWGGHYLFRRGTELVAAVEIFTSPGTQGVWERDGMSGEEEATVAFAANALEWISEGDIRGRLCGLF